jgi:hypothetical protein
MDVQFRPIDGISIGGPRQVRVRSVSGAQLFGAAVDAGDNVFAEFESTEATAGLAVTAKATSAGFELAGSFPLTLRTTLANIAGGVDRFVVTVQPVLKRVKLKIGTTGLAQPDLNDLEQQLTARGINAQKRAGDPAFVPVLEGGTLRYDATVKYFSGELLIRQTLS